MTLEKIETEFIIDDGSPSPKILSDSNNLFFLISWLMMKILIQSL